MITLTNTGARVDLLLRRGTPFGRTVTYKVNNAVQNITGYSFAAQVRTLTGTLAATFTCTIIDAPNGKFSFSLIATAINGLTIGTPYTWDLEATTGGMTFELMRGYVNVVDESTQ